jgi:hypothetical protein
MPRGAGFAEASPGFGKKYYRQRGIDLPAPREVVHIVSRHLVGAAYVVQAL